MSYPIDPELAGALAILPRMDFSDLPARCGAR
jgi:hypothetical protein